MDKLDRLTERNAGGIFRVCHHYDEDEKLCYGCVKRTQCNADIFERLAAYEDTGMTPEELKRIFPVPFGTPVYVVDVCGCHHGYAVKCQERQANADKRMKAVAIYSIGKARTRHTCAKVFQRPFSGNYIGKVGQTVFLTMEDVEKAVEKKRKDADNENNP